MKYKDGRALTHSAREEIRHRAVARVLAGESPEAVIEALGFHRSCIYEWLAKYEQAGEAGLQTKPISGRPRKFSDEHAERLRELIKLNPLQLDFHDALWTREMIQSVLWSEFGVEVSERTVSNILARFDITAQRPRLKAYEQDPEAVRQWLEHDWPAINREAKTRQATIYFGDESAIRSDFHRGTSWGLKGEPPVVPKSGRRFSVNMLSAISPKGHFRFMVTDSRINADVFIDFLKRLLHNAKRPVFLIVDGHPTHKAKKVKRFIKATKGKLTLFYLPAYSPELNPDELVWNHVKSHHLGRAVIDDKHTLKALARSVLRSIQRRTDLIKCFFKEAHVQYILT